MLLFPQCVWKIEFHDVIKVAAQSIHHLTAKVQTVHAGFPDRVAGVASVPATQWLSAVCCQCWM